MTVGDWMRAARARLKECQNPDAATDARLLMCGALGVAPGEVRFLDGRTLTSGELTLLNEKLQRRVNGEPLQYIEGEAWFMGLRYRVDLRVLIPRQDTETLCEAALRALKGKECPRVLDLCTGSGALAIAIRHYQPSAEVTATDISDEALQLARENARMNGAEVKFLSGDGLEPVRGMAFDLIVCNPPYLTCEDMDELQTEVKREPALALFGGADGLAFYRAFSRELAPHLLPGGTAMFEVGEGQAGEVRAILEKALPGAMSGTINDLCGIARVVWIRSL